MSPAEIDSVVLILTAQCNLRCTYCYQTAKKPLSMRWDVLRASIDLALDSPSQEIKLIFVGGEPLLEWAALRKAVEYARAHSPRGKSIEYRISTNGLLISDEIAQFLEAHRFEVQLSFDGIARAQNKRQEGTFPALDRLLDWLRQITPDLFRKRLRTSSIQIPATIPFMAESVRYFIGKGVRDISLSPSLKPSPGWTDGGIQKLEVQFRRIYNDSVGHFEKTGEVPLALFRKMPNDASAGEDPGTCRAAIGKTLAVDANGQLYGCAMFAESYQEFPSELLKGQLAPLRMGELRQRSFHRRHAAYRAAAAKTGLFGDREKRYSSYGRCADCPYSGHCGVCPVSIGYDARNTDPHRVPDFICAFNRVALKYREMFPCIPDPLDNLNSVLKRIIATTPT